MAVQNVKKIKPGCITKSEIMSDYKPTF